MSEQASCAANSYSGGSLGQINLQFEFRGGAASQPALARCLVSVGTLIGTTTG